MQKEWRTATKPIFLWFGLVIPLSCTKSLKMRRKTDVKVLQIHFVLNRYRRKSNLGHTAIEFFCSGRHMIETCPKLSCLTALISFFLFKGAGSFKRSYKNCGNVEEYKAYRLIPPMSPLFNGWTIPLRRLLQTDLPDHYFMVSSYDLEGRVHRYSHSYIR